MIKVRFNLKVERRERQTLNVKTGSCSARIYHNLMGRSATGLSGSSSQYLGWGRDGWMDG